MLMRQRLNLEAGSQERCTPGAMRVRSNDSSLLSVPQHLSLIHIAQTAAIRDALLAELVCIDRAPLPLGENMAMPAIAPVHKTENYDMVQAKLCMLLSLIHISRQNWTK